MTDTLRNIESIYRGESTRLRATMIRVLRDFDLAEEVVHDAFARALEKWPTDGIPATPLAWLTTVAKRIAIDRLRKRREESHDEATMDNARSEWRPSRQSTIGELEKIDADDEGIADDRLRLIFLACHPSLARESQVALTLSLLGGIETPDIARAFLVSTETVAQRLVRAKRKIRAANVPMKLPTKELRAERLPNVLSVIYLIFNEGYTASRGDELMRVDLSDEAIRLARLLDEEMPECAPVLGLWALMTLHHARRAARAGKNGEPITLDLQDRSLYDRREIAQGEVLLAHARRLDPNDFYVLQAEIAAVHACARSAAETDWARIVGFYDRLLDRADSPVVRLNRAVALSMSGRGPEALAAIESLTGEKSLTEYPHFFGVKAEILLRLGRPTEAAAAFDEAISLAQNSAERRHYEGRRRSALEGPSPAD